MPQITFTCNQKDLELITEVDELADKENRSRSGMIVLLLQAAVKERLRKRNGKKLHIQDNSADKC